MAVGVSNPEAVLAYVSCSPCFNERRDCYLSVEIPAIPGLLSGTQGSLFWTDPTALQSLASMAGHTRREILIDDGRSGKIGLVALGARAGT